MKRRNADNGKLRRPLKRTKITEGMYGNSMLYLKFAMVWASVVLADYMLEFRFEFLWPFWMMLRSVYDSYRYQGLAFSVFFICIALTSDMICFFFIPVQYIFFAASTYVWVQYVWYSFADKGICLPTVAICCFIIYMEGVRGGAGNSGSRTLAAHAVGYPAVTLGVGVKAYVGKRIRAQTQRSVRQQNEFYFQLMRDALPQRGLPPPGECPSDCECNLPVNSNSASNSASGSASSGASGSASSGAPVKATNGSVLTPRRRSAENGHCATEKDILHAKLEAIQQHLERKQAKEQEKAQTLANSHTPCPMSNSPALMGHSTMGNSHILGNSHMFGNSHTMSHSHSHIGNSHTSVGNSHTLGNNHSVASNSNGAVGKSHGAVGNSHGAVGNSHGAVGNSHAFSNGVASGPGCPPRDEEKHVHSKSSSKSSKYDKKEANTIKEERRKHKNRDKDSSDSHKITEQPKEQISSSKEADSTTDGVKIKEANGNSKEKDKETKEREREAKEREREAKERERETREREREAERREREREREAERREREREKEREAERREREREREREARIARETAEELRRIKAELASSKAELAAAKSSLAGVKAELATAKAAEAEAKKQLAAEKQRRQEKHTHNKSCAWGRERAVLERRLADERRARNSAEQQLHHAQQTVPECGRCTGAESEAAALRHELSRARCDLRAAHDQVRTLESNNSRASSCGENGTAVGAGWAVRAGQLERALSAETRVKLDLLSALGSANRRMHIQDSIINRQEKELEELKAQMLAVMPSEFMPGVASSMSVSKLRLSDSSPLDPNASVYTPKQLCSDA